MSLNNNKKNFSYNGSFYTCRICNRSWDYLDKNKPRLQSVFLACPDCRNKQKKH